MKYRIEIEGAFWTGYEFAMGMMLAVLPVAAIVWAVFNLFRGD